MAFWRKCILKMWIKSVHIPNVVGSEINMFILSVTSVREYIIDRNYWHNFLDQFMYNSMRRRTPLISNLYRQTRDCLPRPMTMRVTKSVRYIKVSRYYVVFYFILKKNNLYCHQPYVQISIKMFLCHIFLYKKPMKPISFFYRRFICDFKSVINRTVVVDRRKLVFGQILQLHNNRNSQIRFRLF